MTQPKWLFAASMSFPQFPSDEEEWLAGLHHDDFAKRQMMATVLRCCKRAIPSFDMRDTMVPACPPGSLERWERLRFGPLAPNCGFQRLGVDGPMRSVISEYSSTPTHAEAALVEAKAGRTIGQRRPESQTSV